ncbi:MAG: arylsulfatase [Bacteroidota bacterium]
MKERISLRAICRIFEVSLNWLQAFAHLLWEQNHTFRRLLLLSLLAYCLAACQQKKMTSPPPNIVLIMTDDQGYGDLSLHGNDSISTPVLDRLAKESVQLNRFYVSQVCAPTRASLLTGRYHPRTGVTGVTGRREVMRTSETTLAEILKSAGYQTGIFGKWHNGEQYPNDPNGQGFDEFYGFCAGHWNNYFDTQLTHNQSTVKTKGYITDVLTDKAIDFIQQNESQPFFCYIPYNTPHSPMQVADRYFEKYKAKGLSDFNAAAYGMCENIDDNVGRILATLEAQNLSENTILIFTTDNGPNGNRYNGDMKGWKGHYDEGGVRVPFFLRYPKANYEVANSIPALAAHIDVLPTLLDLCGVAVPDSLHLDGRSLVPLFEDRNAVWEARNIYSFRHGQTFQNHPGAVRSPQYRWVIDRDSSIALYDMIKDPSQKQNIAIDEPEVVQKLALAYQKMFEEVSKNGTNPPPIPVGYTAAKKVHLPAIEAQKVLGDLRFKEGHAWANDWITNWSKTEDRMLWELEVVRAGTYLVQLEYTVDAPNTGALVAVRSKDRQISNNINSAFDPEYLASPDRVPRKEVYEKDWAILDMGEIYLEAGTQNIELAALAIPAKRVADLKGLYLVWKE